MRIPAQRIPDHLTPNAPISVLNSDYGCFNSAMPYTHAIALAARGEVEAIATRSGKIRYLRLLTEKEQPPRLVLEDITDSVKRARSSAGIVAQTRMGVYREKVESVKVDQSGLSERVVIGHVWALYQQPAKAV